MTGGIYQILNLTNGKRYVGSAQHYDKRYRTHRDCLNRGAHHSPHLQAAWKKYGALAFSFLALEEVEDIALLLEREQFWIDLLQPEYNHCRVAGSRRGVKVSEESRQLMRDVAHWSGKHLPDDVRQRISAALQGRVMDEGTRAKIAATLTGQPFTDARRANIARGRKGIRRPVTSAAHRQHLSEALKGRTPSQATLDAARAANTGKPLSDEHKAKVSAGLKGKKRPPRTPEQKERYRQAALKRMADPARRQHLSDTLKAKGIAPSMEARLKGAQARKHS